MAGSRVKFVGDAVFASTFLQQTAALTYKNLLVAWRSRRATVLRLLAPGIFLLLALVIQLSLDANSRREQRIRETSSSGPELIGSIPDCNQDIYIGNRQCVTFLYSPNDSSVVEDIVSGIKSLNAQPIPDSKVLGFASRGAAEDYMLKHPETTLGAVHFDVDSSAGLPFGSSKAINYVIQSNNTVKGFRGQYQPTVTWFTLPFASAVARETAKVQLTRAGDAAAAAQLKWEPSLARFPHPQLRSIGMVGYVLGPFIFAACMFGMVMQLGNIVGEKETGLVTSLKHMGLLQSSYWASWIAFDVLMALATALSIVVWGNIMQFRFFLRNDPGILVALYWLFALALSSFAYFISVFMRRAQSAVYTGFVVFLVGWICQTIVLFGLPYEPDYYFHPNHVAKGFFWIFACLPWCPLVKATTDLGKATNSEKDPGLRWSQRESYCQYTPDPSNQPLYNPSDIFMDFECIYPISQCLITLLIQAAAWLILAIYLDNVLPTGHGKTRPLWYFLLPSYWVNSKASTTRQLRRTESLTGSVNCRVSGSGDSWPKSGLRDPAKLSHEQQLQQGQPVAKDSANGADGPGTPCCTATAVSHRSGSAADASVVMGPTQEDDDVLAEAGRMRALLRHKAHYISRSTRADLHALKHTAAAAAAAARNDSVEEADLSLRFAVEVYGLSKVFRAGSCCSPSSCTGCIDKAAAAGVGGNNSIAGNAGEFWAIRDSWFGIEEGQLFCLLGPNGAGKTTTINCLTGILAPSGGDVLVCGESISTEGSLDRIRPQVGVCPQFDVLWGELTGMEHLVVAGHVKGLRFSQVRQHAAELLGRVQLTSAAGVRSGSYSGGMKRRLSVALALLGNPHVLYLDEPTTGMDPISRRYVWDVIQAAKPGRAIVLTTHSMEEADILGDRIAIMARGKLKAIGSSIRLKQKFGAGYQVVVTMQDHSFKPRRPPSTTGSKEAAPAQDAQAFNLLLPRGSPLAPQNTEGSVLADLIVHQEQQQGQQQQQQQAKVTAASAAAATAAAKQAVKVMFAEHLSGLAPAEEGKRQLRYLVPQHQQQQLVGVLQVMEQAIAASKANQGSSTAQQGSLTGVADVQLSLTSLEEVFLNIAKQAELEEAAVSRARVTVQLPDTGKEVCIGIGQDWIEIPDTEQAPASGSAAVEVSKAAASGDHKIRCYRVKWVQDDSGALTVLEILPVLSKTESGCSAASSLAPVAG